MSRLLATISDQEIIQHDDGTFSFQAGLSIDGDGSPRCYGPDNSGLDYTANAGHAGDWYGIVTDEEGEPVIQGVNDPYPGMYISTTSLEHREYAYTDPRRYIDSETVAYVVCPGLLARKATGAVLGCRVVVTDTRTEKSLHAVCADIGPATHLGEVSIEVANLLGIPSSPKNGGTEARMIRYTFHAGEAAKGYTLQRLG